MVIVLGVGKISSLGMYHQDMFFLLVFTKTVGLICIKFFRLIQSRKMWEKFYLLRYKLFVAIIEILFQFRVFTDSGKLTQDLSGKINYKKSINILLSTPHQYYIYLQQYSDLRMKFKCTPIRVKSMLSEFFW